MQLNSIFSKPVDRPIEGVIKADDESGLQIEVEEYVLTNEVSKHLNAFLEAYLEYQHANGAWVSGFFGSGKSHLLKMLAYILENRTVNSSSMLEYFLPKCADDEFLKGNLKRAAQIPSHSILFNIDQKADAISTNDTDAVLAVFVKVFNEMCGFYGKWGYLAQFERDMVQQGVYEPFQEAYQQLSEKTWASDRHLALAKKTQIARAYAQVTGSSQEHVKDIIKDYRDDYKLSIEDFAHMVKEYIDKQEPGFRLNFFVDEVGQYIAESTKLMTNLQTIAESLATICDGQAWIVVTSQVDMDKVIGNINRQQQHDFSKIMARFKMRLKLTSANVDEVIATRLLHKNAAGENALKGLYHQQKNNFGTFFDFSDSRTYRNFRNEQNFINLYPFIPYQFVLFQQALTNLSDHNAFEGRHAAIGERSMLGVFQTVAIQVKDQELGSLATFDRMFAGIRTMLKTQNQLSIQNAEPNLNDDFAVRVLKALFLVKYVKEFKATAHNVRILMTDGFNQNLGELKTKIEAALALLEQQTYIQRNGDEYEFLTNEEKDIEQEIKSTDIDPAETLDKLKENIFDGIIRTSKIRHADSNQDFEFTKKVDQKIYGREHELTIQVISPEHEHAEDTAALTTMSMGLPQLIIALPTDPRLVSDLYLYCKTERFIQQATTNNQSESVMRIIGQKRVQNQNRLSGLQTSVRDLVAQAAYYVNGKCLEMSSQDASANIQTAFARLVTST
ncbi:MAG: BREX system P-loop protein BrxC, partial [Anaerolineaceae bacterium]|nr:BREX system P-loop protein BrxC [Anaerolineaceae bacterium]